MTGNKVVTFISAYYKRDFDRKLAPNVKYFSIALLNTVKNRTFMGKFKPDLPKIGMVIFL